MPGVQVINVTTAMILVFMIIFADIKNVCDKECSKKGCDWIGYIEPFMIIIIKITNQRHYHNDKSR